MNDYQNRYGVFPYLTNPRFTLNMHRMVTKRTHFSFPVPKQLNEVARVPLLRQESPVKIRQLWLEQFKSRNDVVVGTMAKAEFEQFKANAMACPMFLSPVTKNSDGSSYFNLITQFQDGKYCLLTDLEAFRTNPLNASPMMVVTIYDELVAEKGIALIRGDIINRLEISRDDANSILKFLRIFYTNKFDTVKQFNEKPREFDYNQFLKTARAVLFDSSGVSNRM
jgi:ATP synthase F1 complex assembly factor 1